MAANEMGRKESPWCQSCGALTPHHAMQLDGVKEDTEAAWGAINIQRKTYRELLSSVHIQTQTFTILFIQVSSHLAEQRLTEILQG